MAEEEDDLIRRSFSDDYIYGISNPETIFASALSAQTMFPVLSPDEMAGHYSENDVAQAVRQGLITGPGGAWDILSKRVEGIPEYRARFDTVIGPKPIAFTDISDALAAFLDFEWRGVASPFDLYLRNGTEMEPAAMRGMELFYGKAECAACHSGRFQTDHDFHAIAMPQIGPGKAARFEAHAQDTGRMRVTGNPDDAYAFRTPSLRNVALTGPYGHNGAYPTLDGILRHHRDPVEGFESWTREMAKLPEAPWLQKIDFVIQTDTREMARQKAAISMPVLALSDGDLVDLEAFLHSLTGDSAETRPLGRPDRVPSGLPVD